MYTTCDCIKRNGLQDKCPRALCQGRSVCMSFPTPGCCPASFPLRYANLTMGVKKRRCVTSCPPPPYCSCDMPTACCGPSNSACAAPSPIPCSPSPLCCPPLPEAGIPDPRIWNSCNTPASYPCDQQQISYNPCYTNLCPARYLPKTSGPCTWPCACKAHCYDTKPKRCC